MYAETCPVAVFAFFSYWFYSVFLWLRDFFTTLIIVGGRVEIRVLVAAFGRTLSISSYL